MMGTKKVYRAGILLGICLILWGCAAKSTKTEEKTPAKNWRAVAEKAVSLSPVPVREEVADDTVLEDRIHGGRESEDALRPPGGTAAETASGRPLPDQPVTMKMHKVSLPVLLRTLARIVDLDIILNDGIRGTTDIVISDVPWNQAFTGVLDTYGLTWDWSGDILRVLSVQDLEKRQELMEARQTYQQTRNSHELAMMTQARQKRELEPLKTKIIKIRYADLCTLQRNLTQYLSNGELADAPASGPEQESASSPAAFSGKIMIDEYTNSLIIHASRAEIKRVVPLIRMLDRPTRQILIEAHIVEAEATTGRELGIQWGGLGTLDTGNDQSLTLGSDMASAEGSLADGYTAASGNIVDLPVDAATEAISGMTLGVMAQQVGEFVLYAQLLALEQEGRLNILSKPSITTLDHRKAVIKSGEEVPFQTVENDEVSIEWKEAVIKLEVTPHIIDDRIIRLEIVTHKDELDFTNDVNGYPTIITKNAETNVMLFDGQTTVIGGLNKEKSSESGDGIPGLQNMPVLSWLFKSEDKSSEMEELLIFITPHILKTETALPPAS